MKNLKLTIAMLLIIIFTTAKAQKSVYNFDYIYQMEVENPNGKKTVIDYYLSSSYADKTIGIKTDAAVMVIDNELKKMYMFMQAEDGEKTYTTLPVNLKRLTKEVIFSEQPIITHQPGYGNILGHSCDYFTMTSDNLTSEVWVANDISNGATFARSMGLDFMFNLIERSQEVNDDLYGANSLGMPLLIVTKKKRGRREKITTTRCLKFQQANLTIQSNQYQRLF